MFDSHINIMNKIKLKSDERELLEKYVKTGTKNARAISRAKVLLFADKNHNNEYITNVSGVHRQGIWNIKNRYQVGGLESVLNEKQRPGQPRKYSPLQEAEIIATACTDPPKGRKKWTIRLITERLKKRKNFNTLNRETVRLILKKAKLDLG